MRDMTYMLALRSADHTVHIGFRDGQTIIHASNLNERFELIPRAEFEGSSGDDLPLSFLDDCVHWYNVHARTVEARQRPHI